MKHYAVDLETYLISPEIWFPKPVTFSWACIEEPEDKGVIGNDKLTEEITCLENIIKQLLEKANNGNCKLIWQNGYSFDLPVIYYHFPRLRQLVLQTLEDEMHHDTLIRQKLYDISTTGRLKLKKGSYSLSGMAKLYLGKDIEKWKKGDDIWRLRYNELDGIPAYKYPKEARDYALMDVEILRDVFIAQESLRKEKGFGSMNTESLQIKSGFVLQLASEKGMEIDKQKLDLFESSLSEQLGPLRQTLLELGFASYNKKGQYAKENKKFISYLETSYSDFITRTDPTNTHPQGQIRVDEEALSTYPDDKVISTRLQMSLLEKYQGTYAKNIRKHGLIFKERYDILKETARTSSFVQTMPRDGGIREIFKARKGKVLITIDYAAIEGCATAQNLWDQLRSRTLLDFLNSGDKPQDYHAIIGHVAYANLTQTQPDIMKFQEIRKTDKLAKSLRDQCKAIGLGKPGGLGNETTCKVSAKQGIPLSVEQAEEYSKIFFEVVPDLKIFLKKELPKRMTSGDYSYPYAYEVCGYYRNMCTYCSAANGENMQTRAALGAKEAIWRCFRTCKTLGRTEFLAFIHDELIFETDEIGSEETAKELAMQMCAGMQKYIPDCRISTEYAIMSNWSKKEENHLKTGKVWRNPVEEKSIRV